MIIQKKNCDEATRVMPEGEDHWGCQNKMPFPVRIWLTDLPNIGEGGQWPPGPPPPPGFGSRSMNCQP